MRSGAGDDGHTRAQSRAQARRERMRKVRRQRLLVAAALIAVVGLIIALRGGGSPHTRGAGIGKSVPTSGRQTVQQQVAAGAVATVGMQPGASAAYAAAGKRAGLPGDILIADRGNDRVLLVDPQRRVLWRFPTAADLAKGRRLVFDDDTFVAPGGRTVVANEEDNQAIVSIGVASHQLQVLFGHPGVKGAGTTHLNTPDDAYPLADGSITAADAYNCRILFIRNHRVIRRYGSASRCRHDPPRYFGAVNGDTPTPDGGILISEIPGHWVDWIDRSGRLRFAVRAPVSYPSDPQPLPRDRILLADYANPGQVLIITRRGKILWRYRKRTGHGRLDHPSLALSLPNGNIAVNDDYRHRVVVINPKTKRIVWQYGRTDLAGTGANRLRIPDGTDFVPVTRNGQPDWADVVHP
jgi:hypothetical protein